MIAARFAAAVAPEVDELVFSIHRAARPVAQPLLNREDPERMILGLLSGVIDLVLSDQLTQQALLLRGRYRRPSDLAGHLADLLDAGRLTQRDDRLIASREVVDYLRRFEDLRGDVAEELWPAEPAAAAGAPIPEILAASPITDGLLASQLVAPEHERPAHRLYQRLTLLRYLRNDAHAAAWATRDLTGLEMVVFTSAWHARDIPDIPEAADSLIAKGLMHASGDLTAEGIMVRETIEAETNRINGMAFEVLDDRRAEEWLELLRSLRRVPPGDDD